MIKQFGLKRVYVCIDAANILYSQHSLGWRVDYERLKQYFEEECELVSIHFYTGKVSDNKMQEAFLAKLELAGYMVTSKEVKTIQGKTGLVTMKGNLDVEITIGILRDINEFDTLILLSGDSDFAALLDVLKIQRKRVFVMSTHGHVAKELLDRAKFVNLKYLKDRIER